MTEEMLNQVVPVKLFGLEKKSFRDGGMFIGEAENRSTYSINLLYENTVDPADNTHKFGLLPENPNFLKIKKALDDELIEDIKDYPLKDLSESLHDMYGAWVIVDMAKTPVCRVYSENVCQMVDGKPVVVHKAGDLMHKKDPATGKDSEELAIMTSLPVWGFCRKAPNGRWIWLKGNDPMTRIQREINQGRLRYVETEPAKVVKIEEAPAETVENAGGEDTHTAGPVAEAPNLTEVGVG